MTTTLSQRFGSEADALVLSDADIITAVEFDKHGGEHLASGDRGGRIVVFDRAITEPAFVNSHHDTETASMDKQPLPGEWRPYCQFKSHDAEFDYLKSLEIEEKINQIKFLPQVAHGGAHLQSEHLCLTFHENLKNPSNVIALILRCAR